ncbi:MAG: siphovirus Gp157 family protein [Methylovulum sp.]
MNTSLYKLSTEYQLALTELTEMDDLPPAVINDTMEGLSGDLEAKSLNVAAYFLNLDAQAQAMKDAEAKMAARRKAIENKSARLREYLKSNMIACGITKIDSPEFSLRVQPTAGSVVIDDELLLPEGFIEIVESTKIDKAAIKAALKAGPVPGARIAPGYALVIK